MERAAADRAPAEDEQEDGDDSGLPTILPFVPRPTKAASRSADRAPAEDEQEDGDDSGLPTILPFVPRPTKTARRGAAR